MSDAYHLTTSSQSNPELERIIREHGSALTVPAKKVFLTDGHAATGVYYIVSGRTRHYLLGADGSEKVFFILTSGWFFEESACLLAAQPRFHVMAEEATSLLFIPSGTFEALLRQSPVFNEAILRNQARMYRMLCRQIESQSFLSSKDRFLELLYHSADTSFAFDGKWYSLKHIYPQQELAAILGVSRVTISKFVNEFCNEGVIRIVNRRMQINIEHYNRMEDSFDDQ